MVKLIELQEKAEAKARELFPGKKYDCNMATMIAVGETLREVDDIDYINPNVLKALSPMSAGMGAWEGPCGAVAAGSTAIGLKYGSSDPSDQKQITVAWEKSGQYLRWFKYNKFGSYNCFDLRAYPFDMKKCTNYVVQASRKLVDILTEENPEVTR
jgi:hypothetical protein